MSIFRSENMLLCQIYMPCEAAYYITSELGEQKIVQFRDLNEQNIKGRRFINDIAFCEDLEGKLYYLNLQTKDYNIPIESDIEIPRAPNQRQKIDLMTPGTADFDLLRKLYNEVKEISYHLSPLERNVTLHLEYQAIIKTTCNLLYQRVASLFDPELGQDLNVHIIGGVIPRAKWNGFERSLWRMYHGNYVLRFSDINSRRDQEDERRLFVILVHGTLMKETIIKLCLSFSADMYDIPESRVRCTEMNMKNKSIIADLQKAVATSREHYVKPLNMAASYLLRWLIQLKKMKAIYHTMNKFKIDDSTQFLIAECWVPEGSFEELGVILSEQALKSSADVKPLILIMDYEEENPPTYFRLNKFTKSFQNIINAYGIANYKELNPRIIVRKAARILSSSVDILAGVIEADANYIKDKVPYTVITFPFLFAVMFGDMGHGIILISIALFLICKEGKLKKNKNNEIFTMVFGGRYIILLMGLFSVYTGFIYNDIFAYFMNIFGLRWSVPDEVVKAAKGNPHLQLDPKNAFHRPPYPVGLDPTWRVSENAIEVTNSFKMKISIIIGVMQMMFGLWLSLFNMLYFKDYLSIFAEFIPQVLFFGALFGYFVFLIFFKWCTYGTDFDPGRSPACAPSVIITFVSMVLSSNKEKLKGCDEMMYKYQDIAEKVIYYMAISCIPWLLLVKPLYLIFTKTTPIERNTMKKHHKSIHIADKSNFEESGFYNENITITRASILSSFEKKPEKKESEGTGDLIIHQIIHTIEFILGTVSYTASYLRLWALSLAHENLSHVLIEMVLVPSISVSMKIPFYAAGIFAAIGFCAWALLSVAILVIMEGLSAFLHALRLHWMEFQIKFYVGQGYPFTPFSFKYAADDALRELK